MSRCHYALAVIHFAMAASFWFDGSLAHALCTLAASMIYAAIGNRYAKFKCNEGKLGH
jgi:hypothetical protein